MEFVVSPKRITATNRTSKRKNKRTLERIEKLKELSDCKRNFQRQKYSVI